MLAGSGWNTLARECALWTNWASGTSVPYCIEQHAKVQRMKTGKLYVNSYYGSRSYKVLVLDSFFGYYRIKALENIQLPGKGRLLHPGERAWVPHHAIRLIEEDSNGAA